MATITLKNKFIEFELSNETHLIERTNIKFVRLDEFVAVVDSSDRQRNDKRFLIKYSEVTNKDFNNGAEFYEWLVDLVGSDLRSDLNLLNIDNQTRELEQIKAILKEQLKYLKKIYSHD